MALAFVLTLILVPIIEIYVIVQVAQQIGAGETVLLLIAQTLLGGWIVKREGRRALRSLREQVGAGAMPSRQLTDAALIMIGGILIMVPGFVTSVVGLLLVLPPTRAGARWVLAWFLARRVEATIRRMASTPGPTGRIPPAPGPLGPRPDPRGGPVIRGEIVDDDRP